MATVSLAGAAHQSAAACARPLGVSQLSGFGTLDAGDTDKLHLLDLPRGLQCLQYRCAREHQVMARALKRAAVQAAMIQQASLGAPLSLPAAVSVARTM
eukprot:11260-Heterococcus_DN1.PRE.2